MYRIKVDASCNRAYTDMGRVFELLKRIEQLSEVFDKYMEEFEVRISITNDPYGGEKGTTISVSAEDMCGNNDECRENMEYMLGELKKSIGAGWD